MAEVFLRRGVDGFRGGRYSSASLLLTQRSLKRETTDFTDVYAVQATIFNNLQPMSVGIWFWTQKLIPAQKKETAKISEMESSPVINFVYGIEQTSYLTKEFDPGSD